MSEMAARVRPQASRVGGVLWLVFMVGMWIVFFVALFPQFVPARSAVLPATLLMTALVVAFDFAWYMTLAVLVSRAKRAILRTALARRIEQAMGAVLIGLGVRVALERR